MGNFVFLIIALFILAALLRIDFFFTILYLFVGVYILTHLWSRRVLRNLGLERQMTNRAFSGDQVEVTLRLTNNSRLPIPWLMLSESLPVELYGQIFREVVTIAGLGQHVTRYKLSSRKRGYYKIGPLQLHTGDILGIRKELQAEFPADYLIIYPRVLPMTQLGLPAHSPQAVLPTPVPLFRDPNRMIGVRDYIPGDNPRHIHWPATASTGQMVVKQFQAAIARDNAIFLNLDLDDYSQRGFPDTAIELAIVVAASLANHIIGQERLPAGLVTSGYDPLSDKPCQFVVAPNKGQGQLMQILEVLARVQAIKNCDFLRVLRQQALHLSWGTTLLIITSHTSPDLQDTLLLLKRAGFRITLVLVDPIRMRTEALPADGFDVDLPRFKIQREKDIELWTPVM